MKSLVKSIPVTALFLPVNSRARGYYKFQVETGAAILYKITRKVYIYGFQPCTTWQPSEGSNYLSHGY